MKGFTPTSFFDEETETVSDNPTPSGSSHKFKESDEELSFIQMYMTDLESIIPASAEEKSKLIHSLTHGDSSVVKRLIECNLSKVAEIAEKYRGCGVTFGDLIQEGNIGLMVAISEYNDHCGDFEDFITTKITFAIENTINEQINSDRIGQHLADKLNLLDKATKELNEKLGRVPSIAELAEEMSVEEEEVSLLLKTSLDTLSINEDTQITNEVSENGVTPNLTTPSSGSDPLTWRHRKK